MSSVAEAELGALFINAKTAVSMQQTLIKLGNSQPHTPMQTVGGPADEFPANFFILFFAPQNQTTQTPRKITKKRPTAD